MRFRSLTASLLLGAALAPAETKILENFTLIDGAGRQPVVNAALVLVDGRIRYAGPKSAMQVPPGPAERVNLAGKFVMPGIINLHAHLGAVKGLVQDPKNYTRENLHRQLATYAAYGVTTVVSMGSDSDLIFQTRAEQRSGRSSQTRVYTAWRGFTGVAGYPTAAAGMKGVPFEVASRADVEKAIAQLADKKVDLVKIWVDDHLGREKKIPMDLCRAIIDGAHKHGLKVGAHIFYLEDARQLVEAGLDGLAHSVRDKPVDDALIALMKKKGAWQQAPTLAREVSTFVYAKRAPFLDDAFFTKSVEPEVLKTIGGAEYQKKAGSDPDLAKLPGFLETAKQNLKRLADAGVRYGFGTDSGPPARFTGYFEHMEMELMAQAGLTPMQIITAATKSSAEFLGASKDIGTLETGRWGDFLVLARNPLADIKNSRSIESVYISGNAVK